MSIPNARLITSKKFWGLCLTQACGAINDNLVKNAALILAMFILGKGGVGLSALASGLLIAPYALLSAVSGSIADHYPKHRLILFAKLAEVLLMALATVGFLSENVPLLLGVVFLLGCQAAFFSPLKYGILPELLSEHEMLAGNGLLEATVFIAILVGTVIGGAFILQPHGGLAVSVIGGFVALVGLASATRIPKVAAAAPDSQLSWRFLRETGRVLRDARALPAVWTAILGLSCFWTIGATLLTEFPVLVRDVLKSDGDVVTLLLTVFAMGVGVGSIGCAKLLDGEVSPKFVPLAGLGISLFCWDFASALQAAPHFTGITTLLGSWVGLRMIADLFWLSACGGLFSVPLYALIQEHSPRAARSRMIAANNVLNAVFMVIGALATAALGSMSFSAPVILKIAAVANLGTAFWMLTRYLHEVGLSIMRGYFKLFHRASISGLENLEALGDKAVIVVNHQSFLDGCFVAAFMPGRPIFAIDVAQAKRFWFLRCILDIFPVSSTNPMAAKTMVNMVRGGRRLVIFPEGRITLTGALMKLYDGPGMIADKAGAPILPIRIDGLQSHHFSRMKGKLPLRWFPRISMTILPPVQVVVPEGVTGKARREAMTTLLSDVMVGAAFRPEQCHKTLFQALIDAHRQYDLGKPVLAEATLQNDGAILLTEMTFKRLILASIILGKKLATVTHPGDYVGVMLPNAVGAAVTFFALQSQARVPAMLNFSAGADSMLSACRAAEIRVILTSRKFIAKAKLDKQAEALSQVATLVFLEDIRAGITLRDKLAGKWAARSPRRLPGARVSPDDVAVVLFTSGSEGTPKGVALSHRNLLSNCRQAAAVVDFNPSDRVFNALPMFHSFGLTGGTLLPLLHGVRTFLYPSPLHYKQVPEALYSEQSTIMFGTDSFLSGYARKGNPADFQSLRYIFAGAERVRPETRATYMAHFKKPIFEGYGATETSPILSLNTYTHSRPGTVGRMMPGMAYRLETVPGIDDGGRLLVQGPNIMKGYLKPENPGVIEAPDNGWYDTGDVVQFDADGYITIKGRAKRFAKIAGEMVSMFAAESLASQVWPSEHHVVVALPDERKGQRLILVTTEKAAKVPEILAFAREKGIAELMIPRAILVVDSIPLLGTGKVNYPAVQAMVEQQTRGDIDCSAEAA